MFEKVNITGFLPFGNVKTNPTELIIESLKQKPHHALSCIDKLDVTTQAVDEYLHRVAQVCSSLPPHTRVFNLHMGVAPNKVYYLEQCGYNNKDFRIPDNSGQQFTKQPINQGMQLDRDLRTGLDLQGLAGKLRERGHQVQISQDPGRFLCNYIYFKSLQGCKDGMESLFVHFPKLGITEHEQNMKFVSDLIEIMTSK